MAAQRLHAHESPTSRAFPAPQLRKPLSRVLSAYEFAIDVASRHVTLPDDDPVFQVHRPPWPWAASFFQAAA